MSKFADVVAEHDADLTAGGPESADNGICRAGSVYPRTGAGACCLPVLAGSQSPAGIRSGDEKPAPDGAAAGTVRPASDRKSALPAEVRRSAARQTSPASADDRPVRAGNQASGPAHQRGQMQGAAARQHARQKAALKDLSRQRGLPRRPDVAASSVAADTRMMQQVQLKGAAGS
jgi:hypothetical protein